MLPARTLMLAGRVAHTLRAGGLLTQADRDEAAGLIEQLAEFVAELPEPERRKPSDTPEARRERKQRSRLGHTPEGVTSRDRGVTGRDMGRDQLLLGGAEVLADYEVTEDSEGRDEGRDITEMSNSTAAAELLTTNSLTSKSVLASKNQNQLIATDSHTGLSIVRQTPSKPPARSVAEITESIATLMASVAAGTDARIANEKLLRWKAEVAFAYWAKRMGHERSLLDPKRERRLMERLRESDGDLHELLYAVDGAQRDDWIMGRDPRSPRKYDGDETIFRDRAQVERLARLVPAYNRGEPHPMAKKYAALMGEGGDAPPAPQEVAHA